MANVVVADPRLEVLVDPAARVERLGSGATWSEGPLWLPDEQAVVWSDIPGNRILRWTAATGEVTVDRTEVEFTNGRTRDRQGRMVTCSHGRRAVERTEADGKTIVLVDRFGEARLNSPNDIVVASDGAIWFTDPPYGIIQPHEGHPGEREYGAHYVFRYVPGAEDPTPVITDMEEPNGLAFSPDERLLYVSDTSSALRTDGTGQHCIRVYDVTDDRRCVNGRVFAEISPGVADGFRVDEHGNVWTSSGDSVQIFAPDGTWLGKIAIPEVVGNVCFGGPAGDELFVAASTSLYRVRTRTRGATG
ncbi:MAG: gluconolactonase [Pseudonocardiales bacterium]|nr:gluconolactonase [Pseudonocardiales bacterium]